MNVLSRVAYELRRNRRGRHRFLRAGLLRVGIVLLLFNLVILISACSNPLSNPSQSGGSTDTTDTAPIPSPTKAQTSSNGYTPPTITLQTIGCPSLSINWDKLVGTRANVNKVQQVICGSLEGSGSLAALVNVRYYSADAKLDVYVYDNLYATPSQRFSLKGLLNGKAQISSVGSVTTAEASPKDPIQGVIDLYKEYSWNGSSFAQVLFPGIFPDVTRYQADQAQQLVASEIAALKPGQTTAQIADAWRTSAGGVINRMANRLFHWQPSQYTMTFPSHAAQLTILPITVTNLQPGGGGFVATVHHLNEVPTNIFEIEQVISINGSASLNNPGALTQANSPISTGGYAVSSGSVLGQILIYDDTFTIVGNSGPIHSSASSGSVSFTNSVSYHLNAAGLEEGVVAFYPTAQNNVNLSNQAILIKVFLNG